MEIEEEFVLKKHLAIELISCVEVLPKRFRLCIRIIYDIAKQHICFSETQKGKLKRAELTKKL